MLSRSIARRLNFVHRNGVVKKKFNIKINRGEKMLSNHVFIYFFMKNLKGVTTLQTHSGFLPITR
jgi:hypothetical protein